MALQENGEYREQGKYEDVFPRRANCCPISTNDDFHFFHTSFRFEVTAFQVAPALQYSFPYRADSMIRTAVEGEVRGHHM